MLLVSNNIPISSFQFVQNALTSIYPLVALAVERYFAILKPFVHMKRASKSLMWKVILSIWILAFVLSAAGYSIDGLNGWKNATMNEASSSALTSVTRETSLWLETLSTVYVFVLLTFGLVLSSAG